ncbi:MAG: radical SAM protein [Phycisphaeraceae bacterium]|nr:radical SAM protein [Phycisphaeraceae bacterium]
MNSKRHDVVLEAVAAGEQRLSVEQAMTLYHRASLRELGRWATAVADRIHGDRVRTYVKDRNVNYTNVCSASCTFCAFYRRLDDDSAYTLDQLQLHEKVAELVEAGGSQILLQGGMHPELPLSFYEQMLSDLKAAFPKVHLHAFSPPEFVEFVAVFDLDGFPTPGPGRAGELAAETFDRKLEEIMRRLMAAGLASVPGGGGEIFAPHVRDRIGLGKATADQWLTVMR